MCKSPCRNIKDLSPAELEEWLGRIGEPGYRVTQIAEWLYRKRVVSFDDMLNLPARLRDQLTHEFHAFSLHVVDSRTGEDGTVKWLFELPDGEAIETVLITAPQRTTVCISTQVGCPVRCIFCASGRSGWVRDLTSGEIIDQVIYACRHLGERVTNVVVMGIGEPLLNLDGLVPALEAVCDVERLGVGARHVTVSTSGIVPGIHRLAAMNRAWNLALSLHATNDEQRAKLIPPAYRYPLQEVLDACRTYRAETGRMVTLEYALISGHNDTERDMRDLATIARELRAKVNLIPCNAVSDTHTAPDPVAVDRFLSGLLERNVQATVRRRKGEDIQAACGQLRRRCIVSP
jgi:23S rRNA (adenine2503-C2)-methyltransferase